MLGQFAVVISEMASHAFGIEVALSVSVGQTSRLPVLMLMLVLVLMLII